MKIKLKGFAQLIRIELPLAAAICTFFGQIIVLQKSPSFQLIFFGVLPVFLLSAAAMSFNDFFDLETDLINAPERPIPSRKISKQEALIFSVFITIVGLSLTLRLSFLIFLAACLVWLMGFLYNWRLKKTGIWGNLLVSISVGMTFIFGAMTVGQLWHPVVWLFAVIAGLLDLGQEIIGDAYDIEGDEKQGSRSVAVRLGKKRAIQIGTVILLLTLGLFFIPAILAWFPAIYLILLLFISIPILFAIYQLNQPDLERHKPFLQLIYIPATLLLVFIILLQLMIK